MSKKILIVLVLLAIPTFSLMLRFGIYTMHDFHVFRQYEFNKCIVDGIFPCRWASDAGMGYGEPLFNFYGQFPYWIGEIVHTLGFSIVDSVKVLFILTIVLSGSVMYFVSSRYWGRWGGLISAVAYMYAPYRSVDVWVRGALNESLVFVFFPIIFYNLDQYIIRRQGKNLWLLILASAMLVTTHNLSVVMFIPFLLIWWFTRTIRERSVASVPGLALAGVLIVGLTAYYLMPVIFETGLVTLTKTTQGYYDYRAHFATLSQLFISRFWGYGASLWGPVDGLSFSIGQLNWLIVGAVAVLAAVKRNWRSQKLNFYILAILALTALFLTHNKSQFVWDQIHFMAFIQFPWRFLGTALFFLSMAAGALSQVLPVIIKRLMLVMIVVALIGSNFSYFRPDIWRAVSDKEQFSGKLWDEQRSSALQDFWPNSASSEPVAFAPTWPGAVVKSQSAMFPVNSKAEERISFPIVYFPGWKANVNGESLEIFPGKELGLITADVPAGIAEVNLKFTNTWPRSVGNLISGLSLGILMLWYLKTRGLRSV